MMNSALEIQMKHPISIYFDAGIKPHPNGGFAQCFGWLAKDHQGQIIKEGKSVEVRSDDCGSCSVEFDALILALKGINELNLHHEPITIHGDSRAVIDMCNGLGKAHSQTLCAKQQAVASLSANFTSLNFVWIPRELNTQADKLGRMAFNESIEQATRITLMNKIYQLAKRYFGDLYSNKVLTAWYFSIAQKKRLAQMTTAELKHLHGCVSSIPKFIKKNATLFAGHDQVAA